MHTCVWSYGVKEKANRPSFATINHDQVIMPCEAFTKIHIPKSPIIYAIDSLEVTDEVLRRLNVQLPASDITP